MIKMLDLFSGIGGFSYAGEKLVGGFETVAFCEYDKHAQKVLRKHWPDTEIIDDVRELANDADRFRGLVDIVVGGYPCQPFSVAGVRRGDKDDRHLWPEMLKIIQAVRPTWVIGENVAGHISMGLDEVLLDLQNSGYEARCFVIPAVAADAHHRRDRCWIVGYSKHDGSSASGDIRRIQREPDRKASEVKQSARSSDAGTSNVADAISESKGKPSKRFDSQSKDSQAQAKRSETRDRFTDGGEINRNATDPSGEGLQGDVWQGQAGTQRQSERYPAECRWWEPEPAVGRVANGVSGRVHRLRQLGNSIVPQVAARILYAIKEAHEQA